MSKHTKSYEGNIQFSRSAIAFLRSKLFLRLVLILYAIEATWIAFSFRFPMLYDESTHFATIQLYSTSFSPFISGQPTSFDVYGDLTNHGSTLYQYLMTFPYRFIEHITSSFTWQIIFLRIINIILFGIGLLIFYKIFLRVGIKPIFINIAFLFFILLPIVPFIAATINYDNLLFLLTGLFLLWGVKIIKTEVPDWKLYPEFLLIGGLALLVKYEFAPILAISAVYILIEEYKRNRINFTKAFKKSVQQSSKWSIAMIILFAIVIISMLVEVYVKNDLKYHTFFPTCQQTLSPERCTSNYITQRTDYIASTKSQRSTVPLPEASGQWLRLTETATDFTAANKPQIGVVYAKPLPIIYWLVFIFSILAAAAVLVGWRKIPKNSGLLFLATVFFLYTLTVFSFNMHSYYKNHAFTAVQARYLLETLPIFMVLTVMALNGIIGNRLYMKLSGLTVVFILMLQGGGVITHIVRSDQTWYWQNHVIIKVDEKIKGAVDPLVFK